MKIFYPLLKKPMMQDRSEGLMDSTDKKHKNQTVWMVIAVAAVVFGIGIRLYDLMDAPLDFHPTRQLHSALIARGMYYQSLEEVSDWQRTMAVNRWKAEGLIEPQIMERLSAITYRLVGSEQLWVPRVWSIIFWSIGAVFLLLFIKELASTIAVAGAVVMYMFWPYLVTASRAFQPESLMIAAVIAALWAFIKWIKSETLGWALGAGLFCGFAIYVKSVAVFFLAPPLMIAVFRKYGFMDTLKNKHVWIIAGFALLPYLVYHIYGVYVIGLLGGQFAFRFFPQRWIDPVFYIQWLSEINNVYNLWIVVIALIGALLLVKKTYTGLLVGFIAGYVLYGFTFAYHITTHDYYHMPFILPIAAGSGLVLQGVFQESKRAKAQTRAVLFAGLLLFMVWSAWEIRTEFKKNDYSEVVQFWRSLGDDLGHQTRVTGLFPDYGYRAAYWGWMNTSSWATRGDIDLRELSGQEFDYEENLAASLVGQDYFIIADMKELEKQPQLLTYLENRYPVYKEITGVIIFDLRSPESGDE